MSVQVPSASDLSTVQSLLLSIWNKRPDLQKAFPEVATGNYKALAKWAYNTKPNVNLSNVETHPEFTPYISVLNYLMLGSPQPTTPPVVVPSPVVNPPVVTSSMGWLPLLLIGGLLLFGDKK